MKNLFKKILNKTTLIVKILILLLIIGLIYGLFSSSSEEELASEKKTIDWNYDVSIINEKIIKDDISLSYYWENGSKVMKDGRFFPQTKLFKDLLSFQDGFAFAFAVVSITNSGEKDESIDIRDFKSIDSDGVIIDDTYFSSYPTLDPIEYIIDKQGEKIYTFPDIERLKITLTPKSIKKIAILFKFPIDSKSAGLSVSYK